MCYYESPNKIYCIFIAFNRNVKRNTLTQFPIGINKMNYSPTALLKRIRDSKKINDIPKRLGIGIVNHSPHENIFHCCVQKTASQWFLNIFNDDIFYQYTGLLTQLYFKVGLRQDSYEAIPLRSVATPLYIAYSDYLAMPKPKRYRAFFVTRDPRDLAISFYFSTKYSHDLIAYIPKMRKELEALNMKDGLKYAINALEEIGVFEAQRSWANVDDEQHKIFRYEDLANNNRTFLKQLLSYLDVEVSAEKFDVLYNRHSFKSHTKGRSQGEEDISSHYRRGISGEWKEYFDKDVMKHFKSVTGDLLEVLGYAEEPLVKYQSTQPTAKTKTNHHDLEHAIT